MRNSTVVPRHRSILYVVMMIFKGNSGNWSMDQERWFKNIDHCCLFHPFFVLLSEKDIWFNSKLIFDTPVQIRLNKCFESTRIGWGFSQVYKKIRF